MLSALFLAACEPSPKTTGPGTVPTDPDVQTTEPDPSTPPTTTLPGTTTSTTPPCEADPGLSIEEVAWDQPYHENELAVRITLSGPASVAVACALRDDPAEVHLVEADESSEHLLRLSGLLADATYDCTAAAVCPQARAPVTFEVQTASEARGMPDIDTWTYGAAGSEYVLLNHSPDCGWESQRLLVLDRAGRIRWWYDTPAWVGPSVEFRYHGDDRFAWGGGWGPNDLGRPRIVDLFDGEVYDSADAIPDVGASAFHHDGKQLDDGRLLTLEEVPLDGGFGLLGFRVRRVDPATGAVDFDYHSQRALDEGHIPSGSGDAWHANWADIVDGTLYVSLCNLARVIAVDVATGDWLWTFGADGDFSLTDASGAPLGRDGFTQCQHGLEFRSDDHLLVYDNGWERGFTRVSEYALDTTALTATRLWTWTEPDWFETTLGDADWMASGSVLVGAGHADCFSSNPGDRTTVLEIDPATGDKLWELQYGARDDMAYRADSADPCALFANAAYCPALRERLDVLAGVFDASR